MSDQAYKQLSVLLKMKLWREMNEFRQFQNLTWPELLRRGFEALKRELGWENG